MIIEEIKKINSGKKDLQKFGLTIGIFFGLLGGLFWWRSVEYYPFLFTLSAVFLLCGLLFPVLLKPVQKVWMSIAILMGWIMTRIILTFLFYLMVTPLGLLARLFGKDFLKLQFDSNRDSYWEHKTEIKKDKSSYENQY